MLHFPSSSSKQIIVYRKGDMVIDPMNSRDVLPKNVLYVGWGGSCRGGVGHGGLGLAQSCRVGVGWGGSWWVGWVMQGWGG